MLQRRSWCCCLVVALLLAGCAGRRVDRAWQEPRPLGRGIPAYRPPREAPGAVAGTSDFEEPAGIITLRHALSLALMNNPELAASGWRVRAAEAREQQAGLRPNPEIEAEMGEVAGGGDRRGFDAAEVSLALGQLIELGGKRARRRKLAALESSLEAWDYEAKRLDVFTDAARAFVEVLAAQERLALSEDSLRLAEQVFEAVSERVKAGKVPRLEGTKAGVVLSISRIELERTKRDLDAKRKSLAAIWGSIAPKFARAEGSFETIHEVPPLEQLINQVEGNPDIARWEIEMAQRQAALELEKAARIPDVEISAGMQRYSETNDGAYSLGLSVPLPFFDRNQGGISEARHNLAKAAEDSRTADLRVRTDLALTYDALASFYSQATTLKNDVLPAARSAFADASEGYRQGKFDYLTVLDAQRTLFEAQAEYTDALAGYHTARADAERLIGEPLDTPEQTEQNPVEKEDEE